MANNHMVNTKQEDINIIYLYLLLILVILFIISWFIYYNITKFKKVITVSDKFFKTKQIGGLEISSNHRAMRTDIKNTRRTVEEYFILDTERNLYSVEDCLFCGFYAGSFGKYARVLTGDRIEIMGYGGYFDGIPIIYSVRNLS